MSNINSSFSIKNTEVADESELSTREQEWVALEPYFMKNFSIIELDCRLYPKTSGPLDEYDILTLWDELFPGQENFISLLGNALEFNFDTLLDSFNDKDVDIIEIYYDLRELIPILETSNKALKYIENNHASLKHIRLTEKGKESILTQRNAINSFVSNLNNILENYKSRFLEEVERYKKKLDVISITSEES